MIREEVRDLPASLANTTAKIGRIEPVSNVGSTHPKLVPTTEPAFG